ncbi:MAG TPA: hypothetical protein VF591_23175 [Pyrinomonadaceae bacterium]
MIARHGPGLCSDARRCEGLLRDLCGGHHREINILVGALRERVPLDLLAARNSAPAGLLLTRLAKRLEAQLAMTEEASRWGVDSWALALGVVSDAEFKEIQGRRDEAAVPHVDAAPRPAPAKTQPAAEDRPQTEQPAAPTSTRPTATPPSTQKSHTPPATRTPTASNPPAPTPRATPATRPRGGSTAPAPQHTAARTPSPPQATNTSGLQEPAADRAPRGGRTRWRGCLIGCFLLALLSVLLAVGVPFVVNILREEQERRNLEPSPAQTR